MPEGAVGVVADDVVVAAAAAEVDIDENRVESAV